mgnify:FL=1
MARIVRAKYEKGVLRPLEPLDLRDGEEVRVAVVRRSFRGFSERAGKYEFKVDEDVVKEFVEERR